MRLRPAACERSRAYVSLRLDRELAELEERMLGAHLAQCAACRAYDAHVVAFTRELRAAELEPLERPVALPPRRVLLRPVHRLGAVAAALVALLSAGSVVDGVGSDAPVGTAEPRVGHTGPRFFLSNAAIQREQALILITRPGAPLVQPLL